MNSNGAIVGRRRWATILVGVMLLAGGALTPNCHTVFANDKSVYRSFEDRIRSGEIIRRSDLIRQELSDEELRRLLELNAEFTPVTHRQRRQPPPPFRSTSTTPSSEPLALPPQTNDIILPVIGLILIIGVLFLTLGRRHSGSDQSHSFLNRVATFQCPDCHRPICMLGAWKASIQRLPRTAREYETLDETKLTTNQQSVLEPVWIEVHCTYCDSDLFFDEVGVPASPPHSLGDDSEEESGMLATTGHPKTDMSIRSDSERISAGSQARHRADQPVVAASLDAS